MGGSCSSTSAKQKEEDKKIPPGEQWRHARCTVRAQHQLSILSKNGIWDYGHIVER